MDFLGDYLQQGDWVPLGKNIWEQILRTIVARFQERYACFDFDVADGFRYS